MISANARSNLLAYGPSALQDIELVCRSPLAPLREGSHNRKRKSESSCKVMQADGVYKKKNTEPQAQKGRAHLSLSDEHEVQSVTLLRHQ